MVLGTYFVTEFFSLHFWFFFRKWETHTAVLLVYGCVNGGEKIIFIYEIKNIRKGAHSCFEGRARLQRKEGSSQAWLSITMTSVQWALDVMLSQLENSVSTASPVQRWLYKKGKLLESYWKVKSSRKHLCLRVINGPQLVLFFNFQAVLWRIHYASLNMALGLIHYEGPNVALCLLHLCATLIYLAIIWLKNLFGPNVPSQHLCGCAGDHFLMSAFTLNAHSQDYSHYLHYIAVSRPGDTDMMHCSFLLTWID